MMRLAVPVKPGSVRSEQIILFRISDQLFAVSSASVQEVRGTDSLVGGASAINAPGLRKVQRFIRRGDKTLFIVNGAAHFGLPPSQGTLAFVLRNTRTALVIDSIEKMTSMTRLQALPLSFCHEEHQWYRGLTALDQSVVPVVHPEGFLSAEELISLDAALPPPEEPAESPDEGTELPQ